MKKCCLSMFSLLMILLSGCVLTPRTEHSSTIHDLQPIEPVKPQNKFFIESVNNATPANTKFFYRKEQNTVLLDHYRSWVQSPEQMLLRCLIKKFPLQSSRKSDLTAVKLTITAFEFDLTSSEAVLAMTYTMRKGTRHITGAISITEKFSALELDLMLKAMNKAAAAAAGSLETAVEKFNR